MEENDILIQNLEPNSFEIQNYSSADDNLILNTELDTNWSSSGDYIEYYIYDSNETLVYPDENPIPLDNFSILKGDVFVNPSEDLDYLGFNEGAWIINYNFYRKRLNSDIQNKYYIREISSDRTELKLDSNVISNEDMISSTNNFEAYRKDSVYFTDFLLNFGSNEQVIANNIKLDQTTLNDPLILIKLYEPLPSTFDVKDELWVVEKLSDSLAFKVTFPFTIEEQTFQNQIQGPNLSLNIKNQVGASGQFETYNTLLNTNSTSSFNQIQSILNENNIQINVNYEKYSEYVQFSSAQTRLENFAYKAGRIEHFTNQINALSSQIQSGTTKTSAYSSSKAVYERDIKDLITNFDGYDYFLYYNSGSKDTWPKQTTTLPYILYPTGSTEVLTWLGSTNTGNAYYGGQALSASEFDENNNDRLYNTIPEYLRDDPANDPYKLFVDMAGQYYDDVWVHTKDITNKFSTDNRLDYGISKDLVEVALRDFGVKLYSNNFNNNNIFTSLLGVTPSGSYFPFPEMTNSLPTPSGFEYVNTEISSSNDPISLDGVNKRLYKRLYHNLPYLFKTKGTIAGLEAILSIYGIPDTILRVNEFGGKDRVNSQDWDLQQRVFNYKFDTDGKYIISSSFDSNSNFGGSSPNTVQFRFKTDGIPTNFSQSLYELNKKSALVLEYTGSGLTSGSYSGSISSPYNKYGTLKFIPDLNNLNISSSLYFPFFDGDWWSVQTTVESSNTATLTAANQINKKLGFSGSSISTGFDSSYYFSAPKIVFPSDGDIGIGTKTYKAFSGSFQEIRYYNSKIKNDVFYDYTMNPYSFEGNTINSAPDELFFRADLGTLLNTGSTTSVHPKITGSSTFMTSSFSLGSDFYISSSNFSINRELIHQDQVIGGIKNRITDKITTNEAILPEGNTLSSIRSIQQTSFLSSSYTPDIDYLEIAFSPQNQINDDINAQMGYFNIGEYIGDPRHISQSGRSYPDLDTLRDAYFQKYMASYDLVDFVRLIKFFDNSLFKMIKDYTPARSTLSSGVVVKQHLLERNRQRPPQVSSLNATYSGTLKPQVRDYSTGSGDTGAYEYYGGSSIYRFSGGTGGSLEAFNGLQTSPSASAYGLTNKFGLTQSFLEQKEGKLGQSVELIWNQDEFYNGEFSGSNITVVTQSISPGCMPYHKTPDDPVRYYPLFFSDSLDDAFFGTTTLEFWQDNRNEPLPGYAWLFVDRNPSTGLDEVVKIKLAEKDFDGNEVRDYLIGVEYVQFIFPEGFKKYFVEGTIINSNSAVLNIDTTKGDYLFASSSNGGTENWSLKVSGNISSSANPDVAGFDVNSQNYFHAQSNQQLQPIRFYNDVYQDALGLFDTGSIDYLTTTLNNNDEAYDWGVYTIPRTSNVPWVLSASIAYSASGGGVISSPIITQGTYHSGSANNSTLTQVSPTSGLSSGLASYTLQPGFIETASISLPPVSTNLDPSFFNNNTATFAFGDQIHPYRRTYTFITDFAGFGDISDTVAFNNLDISLATQVKIMLYPIGAYGNYNGSAVLYRDATTINFFDPTTDSNRITISNAITQNANIDGGIQGFGTGYLYMVKTFNQGGAVQFGTNFSDNDTIKVLPNTLSDASGHPLISQAATASFNFTFDEFKIGGQVPSPQPRLNNKFAQQAGGTGQPSGISVPNFDADALENFTTFDIENGVGVMTIDCQGMLDHISDLNYVIESFQIMNNFQVSSNQHIPGIPLSSTSNFNNQVGVKFAVVPVGDPMPDAIIGNFIPGTLRNFNTNTGTQSHFVQDAPFSIGDTLQQIQQTGVNKEIKIALCFRGFDQIFKYWLPSWNCRLIFNESIPNTSNSNTNYYQNGFMGFTNFDFDLGFDIGTELVVIPLFDVTQGANNDNGQIQFPPAKSGLQLNGNIQQRLWVTGSEHHPRQLITSSLFLNNVEITPGSTVTFPDSPIIMGQRLDQYTEDRYSVTGSGVDTATFEYTDAGTNTTFTKNIASTAKMVVSVRNGGTLPTQTSGGGSIGVNLNKTNVLYPTINTTGSMYFIETFISGCRYPNVGGTDASFFEERITRLQPEFDVNNPSLIITNSIGSTEAGYRFTGSLQIYKGSADDKSNIGVPILSRNFIVKDEFDVRNIEISGSFISNFRYNDAFRIAINAEKNLGSYLDITEYTMSIFPSESKFASIVDDPTFYGTALYGSGEVFGGTTAVLNPGYGVYSVPILTELIVPNFYAGNTLPFALALDCQPLINNFNLQRQSTFLMDVDYNNSFGVFKPVNLQQIISGSAQRATVPDSNYTQHTWTDIRYQGSKAQSEFLNVWSPSDFGTYGQLPVIELRNAYFGYFSSFKDPYPLRNDVTRMNLSYLIDGQGNALPPSLQGIAADIVQKIFPVAQTTKLSIDIEAAEQVLEEINQEHSILTVGSYPVPILYSQTSSRGYSNKIAFSGSGRLSLYDNPGTGFNDYSFMVEGTSSGTNDSGRNISLYLNPSANIVSSSYAERAYDLSIAPNGTTIPEGAITFMSESYVSAGQDTSQMQYLDLQFSLPTTYISSADYFRKGNWKRKTKRREYTEFKTALSLEYYSLNSAGTGYNKKNIPFIATDVQLKVWKGATQFDAGSVVDSVVFIKSQSSNTRKGGWGSKSNSRSRKQASGISLDRNLQLNMHVDEDALGAVLSARGLGSDGITGLEWVFIANSGENLYERDSYLRWKITGDMLPGNDGNNTINPATFPGPKYATKFTLIGSKTHLLATENIASTPFWVFASDLPSSAVPSTDTSTRYIYMSSSLINEAYGDTWKQGELPYIPGPYEGFPGNMEPSSTKIGPVYSNLNFKEQDEIRFGNNENYSYKITKVWAPQENIMGDDIGRIKLELDAQIPQATTLNKDFFLVRRNIASANSVILDLEYPYDLATISASYVETQERTGKLLRTKDALLGSVTTQPINGNPISYTNVTLGVTSNSGTGTGAKATMIITQTGGVGTSEVSYIEITDPGSGYSINDVLSIDNIGGSIGRITLTALNIGQKTILTQDNIPAEFSAAGIMFPEFPSNQIETSASIIINDLISKGVINN
tara:strand:- start:8480 stop:17566 length:9087 start_codon:yes stop_codon:yes gene_type:complete